MYKSLFVYPLGHKLNPDRCPGPFLCKDLRDQRAAVPMRAIVLNRGKAFFGRVPRGIQRPRFCIIIKQM